MPSIFEYDAPWRKQWQQAEYKGRPFHVESIAYASGRRTVIHEYPKRDEPYVEDMGRMANRFMVVAYFITYPYDDDSDHRYAILRRRDYRPARNQLIEALEEESVGTLIHPTMGEIQAICTGFNQHDAIREKGGYCSLEIQFVRQGSQGHSNPGEATVDRIMQTSEALRSSASDRARADLADIPR